MEDELLSELCMRGYHVYSEATELLCERKPRNMKDSNCCGKIFRAFNIRGLSYLIREYCKNFPTAKFTATTVSSL